MINCSYKFKGENTTYSYREILEYFINQVKDFNDDIVYSKIQKQDAIFSDLLDKKIELKSQLDSSGEPDYIESGKFTTQTFIDSNSFVVNGARPIFQLNEEDLLKNLIESFSEEVNADEAEGLAKNYISKNHIIKDDAKSLHSLLNSFNWNSPDLQKWIDHCKGTRFENLAVQIYKQVYSDDKSLRRILYGRHKLNDKSAKIITGINLKAEIDILGEDIFGHFDNIVIDSNGCLHVYNYKLTSTPISEWKAVKLEKYKYQLAFLKQILAANGYDVRYTELHIIPVRVKYDSNFDNIEDIVFYNTNNIEFTIKNNNYVFQKYDDVAKYFIKSKSNFDKINSQQLEDINSKLAIFFPDREVKYDGIKKTAEEWIKQNYNSKVQLRIRNSNNPQYAYELYFDDDFKDPVYVKDPKFPPYKNEELVNKVQEHISSIQGNSDKFIQKILRTVQNSRTVGYSMFGNQSGGSFGYSGQHLGITLNKYFKFEKINDKKIYEWDMIEDDILSSAGILMFKNRNTEQIDVIALSSFNLNKQTQFKNRNNIMGSWTPDNTKMGKLVDYPATFGNIEALKTMIILNEVIPNFQSKDMKFGQIVLLSPSNNGQTKYIEVGKFNRECFQECVKIIKRNNPQFQITNNFSQVKFIDPLTLVKQQFLNITDSNNTLFSESDKQTVTDLGFENLQSENSKSVKAEMIRNIMENMQNREGWEYLKSANVRQLIEISKRNYGQESQIATLYLYLAKALTFYSGMPVYDEKYLNKFDKNGFIQSRVPNRTYRGITNMFTSTINNIASQVQSTYNPIGSFIDEFLFKKGYSTTKNNILGNQASYFKNLYRKNEKGEQIMEFRNPYLNSDEFGVLDSDERTLLKKVLFCLAKIRSEIYGSKITNFNFSRYDDPELLKFIDENKSWYFNVPLMKATSASTLQKGIKAQMQEWSRKAKTYLKNGKARYDEFVSGVSSEDSYSEEDFTTLNLRNPFIKGDGVQDEMSREVYLSNHDSDYFEYDLTTIMGHYVTELIKTKELNKTLLTAKAVMLELELLGDTVGDTKGIKQTIELISDHIKANIFNQSIMEPIEQKIVGWLSPFRTLVSDAFIAGNIISMFRDTFEGVWQNMTRTLNHYQTDLTASSVTSAYKEVILGALSNITSIHKVDLLCKLYRLSNMDVYKIADSVATSKSGAFNVENWMYFTLRAPDFLNRMVLFTARCIQDGCWDAYSVENGRLKYDPRKDNRFKAYFNSSPNSKEYIEAKTKYFNAIRQYNSENPENQIGYNDLLPVAYSNQEIENMRNLSNSIYGAYDQSMRARYERMALGWAFGTFSTWMNGIVANYMTKPGIYYDGDLEIEQDVDDSGNKLWITEDGTEAIELVNENGDVTYISSTSGQQLTKNDNWCKAMKHVPRVVQGVYYTLRQTISAMKNKNFNEEIWMDPMNHANLMKFLTDLIIWLIFFSLFKFALDPAYKEYKLKDMKKNTALTNAIAEVLYKSTGRSYDGFGGMLNVIQYLGENTNPPVYSLPIKIVTDLSKVCFGDKTVLQMLHSDIAIFRTFQDTYKAEQKKK